MAFYFRTLYPDLAFRSVEEIDQLTPFMYLSKLEVETTTVSSTPPPCEDIIETLPPLPMVLSPPKPIKKSPEIAHVIYPKQSDTLFWCIYIARHGYPAYNEIGHRYSNTEIEEKQWMMEAMRKSPTKIKECPKRITKAQYQEIMSDFMTNKRITTDMLVAFAIYCDMRIWIVEPDSWYMDIYGNDAMETAPIIIYRKSRTKHQQYGIDLTEGEERDTIVASIKTRLFRYDNYDTPLRAISNYKTANLECIAEQLGIVMEGKYKKQDLYHKIIHKIENI